MNLIGTKAELLKRQIRMNRDNIKSIIRWFKLLDEINEIPEIKFRGDAITACHFLNICILSIYESDMSIGTVHRSVLVPLTRFYGCEWGKPDTRDGKDLVYRTSLDEFAISVVIYLNQETIDQIMCQASVGWYVDTKSLEERKEQ